MGTRRRAGESEAERGQALIIAVFAIVALLVAAGLAIDGGAALTERRRMQNAADAAALAGARQLSASMCNSVGSPTADAAILAEMTAYAQSNGVAGANDIQGFYVRFVGNTISEFSPAVRVGAGAVPQGAAGVRTTTAFTQSNQFLGLVGQDTAEVGATATAVTGPPLASGGIRPFGVSIEALSGLGAGDCFIEDFKNCQENTPDNCLIRNESGEIIGRHRNWLDLGYVWNQSEDPAFGRAVDPSGNASALMEWMTDGWSGRLWSDCAWDRGCRLGDYIHAKPGTTSSPICAAPTETPFVIPIFDITPHYSGIPDPKPGPANQGDDYYHIVGFATVHIPTLNGCDQGGGWLKACIEQIIVGLGQPAPNLGYGAGDACIGHTMVVSLWR